MKAKFKIEHELSDQGEKRITISEWSGGRVFGCWVFVAGVYPDRAGREPKTEDAIKKLLSIIEARHAGQSWLQREPLYFDVQGNKL